MNDPPSKRPRVEDGGGGGEGGEEEQGAEALQATKEREQPRDHFLREEDVGITEYLSPQPGFFAILKRR